MKAERAEVLLRAGVLQPTAKEHAQLDARQLERNGGQCQEAECFRRVAQMYPGISRHCFLFVRQVAVIAHRRGIKKGVERVDSAAKTINVKKPELERNEVNAEVEMADGRGWRQQQRAERRWRRPRLPRLLAIARQRQRCLNIVSGVPATHRAYQLLLTSVV